MITAISHFDQTFLFFIRDHWHSVFLDPVMKAATMAGNRGSIWILLSLLLLIPKKTRAYGMLTIAALLLATLLGEGLIKHLVQRSRPYTDFPSVHLQISPSPTYSFPSGHTASSFAAATVLSRYLKKYSPLFWAIAALIAFSRLYLFMHYPTDVVFGIFIGLCCGGAVIGYYEKIKNHTVHLLHQRVDDP